MMLNIGVACANAMPAHARRNRNNGQERDWAYHYNIPHIVKEVNRKMCKLASNLNVQARISYRAHILHVSSREGYVPMSKKTIKMISLLLYILFIATAVLSYCAHQG
ncbi:hypothetical protein J40TS1_24560 [Paenibacillus montaniterrae]|uniref:Uncharacterized protein n=1 Tax=Paenibacillus montaniterrae TaxID=429341 RepID=A0A919YR66_9BACL|nr:hypothetical protein J40TS1_24560 [Paenibacillus montaniterrae]